VEHSKLAGLQVADAVASGFHFAIKVNRYGETETSYLTHLKKTIYRHKGEAMGYGLKVYKKLPGNLQRSGTGGGGTRRVDLPATGRQRWRRPCRSWMMGAQEGMAS